MTWLLVFTLCVVVDWLYVGWTIKAVAGQAGAAAVFSGALALVGGLGTLLYVSDQWLLIPYVLGHIVGSYSAVIYQTPGHNG